MSLLGLLRNKQVMVGAVDVASNAVETPEAVAETLRAAIKHVEPERIFPYTNCGLAPLLRDVAAGKLCALAVSAEIARTDVGKG